MIRGVKKKTRAAWEKCSFGDLPPRKKNPLGDKERNRRKKDKYDMEQQRKHIHESDERRQMRLCNFVQLGSGLFCNP